MRFLTPILFFAAAFYVQHYNATHARNVVYLPFEMVMPSLKGNFTTQGNYTVALFGVVGCYLLIRELQQYFREKTK